MKLVGVRRSDVVEKRWRESTQRGAGGLPHFDAVRPRSPAYSELVDDDRTRRCLANQDRA